MLSFISLLGLTALSFIWPYKSFVRLIHLRFYMNHSSKVSLTVQIQSNYHKPTFIYVCVNTLLWFQKKELLHIQGEGINNYWKSLLVLFDILSVSFSTFDWNRRFQSDWNQLETIETVCIELDSGLKKQGRKISIFFSKFRSCSIVSFCPLPRLHKMDCENLPNYISFRLILSSTLKSVIRFQIPYQNWNPDWKWKITQHRVKQRLMFFTFSRFRSFNL